jgi:hypothetical protein
MRCGISEEEYWQFYLARLNYRDPIQEGTILDVLGTSRLAPFALSAFHRWNNWRRLAAALA